MAGLQRSEISFRRQGSSGLVWDDKLISEELNSDKASSDQKPELRRSRSDGGGGRRHTVKVEQAEDPPSPRLSSCGFCSYFGRPAGAGAAAAAVKTNKRKSGKAARHR